MNTKRHREQRADLRAIAAALLAASCATAPAPNEAEPPAAADLPSDVAACIDSAADPCEDFYASLAPIFAQIDAVDSPQHALDAPGALHALPIRPFFSTWASGVDTQYSGFEVQPDVQVNGQLTLGENIADLGGIKLAWDAYHRYRDREGPPTPIRRNDITLTDEQLFFVGFAQVWCTLATPEVEQVLIKTDSHAPPRFRVDGPLRNLPAFAETFACGEGTPMNPGNRCEVW